MGRPLGSPNKDKPFRDALRMEIAAAGEDHKELREVAASLIAEAKAGNVAAIKEIADRLDGKVPQPQGGTTELPPIVHGIAWLDPMVPPGTAEAAADAPGSTAAEVR